jgi:hypothetical protein
LKPFNLRRWSITLLIPTRDPKDDRRLASRVQVRRLDHFITDIALILFADINPREGELSGLRWIWILNSEIN